MAVCVLMGSFEALTMMNYGDPDYDHIFAHLVGYFPAHFTMHESVSIIDIDFVQSLNLSDQCSQLWSNS